jgi:hypothetical protein
LVPLYDSLEAWACEYGIDAATVERIRHDMELTADRIPPVTLH